MHRYIVNAILLEKSFYLLVGDVGLELFLSMSIGEDVALRYDTRRTSRSPSCSSNHTIQYNVINV
jgi:hypothetical protein